ncbi:helix-turn-helix domain-containing protein [Rodentibacter haemolyticus]|uniref:Helix-turn-helix domain-containing protein n=1 Tax=Rodentibacter haemolyticus TaxID=2778911 RepID=A0ABX6UWX4_9PAST|nr:helix-turn-helix domain-containing protein [Rodentibacter haemolyticus]QPB42534.1 helix-turn-helix domain-containing protein [Rodentibacter haemolyticus]
MIVTSPKMLSHVIREFRYKDNISQTDIAKQVGIKQATVSNFENTPESTKIETLFKILAALELELVVQPRPTLTKHSSPSSHNLIEEPSATYNSDDDGEIW